MAKRYYLCAHTWNGSKEPEARHTCVSGTHSHCKNVMKARGNHGFYFISTIADPHKLKAYYAKR